jgi:hypothetical protein
MYTAVLLKFGTSGLAVFSSSGLTSRVVKRLILLFVLALVKSLIFSEQLFDLIHLSVAC